MKNVFKKLAIVLFAIGILHQQANADITKTVGASGANFTTLKLAFDAINANTGGVYTGAITLQMIDNTTESATAVINTTNTNWISLLIYPTVSGKTISGSLNTPLIDLNGADNVTMDGRVNLAGLADLTISNTNTGTSARSIRFINDATGNSIKYCTIKGAVPNATAGAILFSTTTGTTGNDNNTIDQCNITNSGSRPYNCIYSAGTASKENSGITISNNNFYDFTNSSATSNGILLAANTTSCTITGNSFYETANPFVPTAAYIYTAINITNTSSGNGFVVTSNYIGGNAAQCGGTAWIVNSSFAHLFRGIYLNVGTTVASSLQSNTIKNFDYSSTSATPWTGIYLNAGSLDVGTITGNTIGSASGNGSISVNFDASTGFSKTIGIYSRSTGTVSIANNTIGSITTNGFSTNAHSLYAIYQELASSGSMTISNNNIGSSITNNSLLASSSAASVTSEKQEVSGIYSTLGTTTRTTQILNNSIAGLYNSYEGITVRALTSGIYTKGGNNTITNNIIRNISTKSGAYGGDVNATLAGIAQITTGSGTTQIVEGNTVYDLHNVHTGNGQIDIYGILYYCSTDNTNLNSLSGNFIQNITASSTQILSSIDGIVLYAGSPTCANNIISLGTSISTGYAIYGIFEKAGTHTGTPNTVDNNKLYFNTIYLGGVVGGTTENSYSFFRELANGQGIYKNNLLINNRSGGTTGKHYAIKLSGTIATWDIDWNDYYAPNGILGRITTTDKTSLADWQAGTVDDASSLNINPAFVNAGGTTEKDYLTSGSVSGNSGTGITTDYFLTTRASTPIMGALEAYNKWTGESSSIWAVDGNWSAASVPSVSTNVLIQDVANDPEISTSVSVSNLAIESGGKLTVAYNGILSVSGGCSNKAGASGLMLKSTASGTGSFINSTAYVNATVERYVAAADWGTWDDGWHNLSSPVVSQAIYPEFVSSYSLGNEDFYKWDEPTNEWINIKISDGIVNPAFESHFSVGRGYMVAYHQTATKEFEGILNNADVVMNGLTFTGTTNVNRSWNLLGNPFPCALTWYTGRTTNNIGGVANIWNETAKSYAPINAGEVIPNGNGFMVSVNNATGGSLTIPIAKRTASAPNWYKNSDYPVIKLFAKNLDNPSYQESQIRFNPASSTGYDNKYDCDFLAGYAPQFYSVMGSENLMVNSLPSVSDETSIPFNFIKNAGTNFSIEVEGLESLPSSAIVYLRDIKLGVEHNVSQIPTYSFTSSLGDDPLRFQIHFGTVGINDQVKPTSIIAYYSDGKLFVITPAKATEVCVFNVQGQLLYKNSIPGTNIQYLPMNLPSGVYFARLTNKEEIKTVKFIVKK